MAEVQAILTAYSHIQCELFYADAALYGPYPLSAYGTVTTPWGWGGTSFCPFFEWINANADPFSTSVCIYLTDGYGRFPDIPPEMPVLWVVTPDGLVASSFPFGEVIHLPKRR
jgi:predicted metal-dependent peptidase